MTESTRSSNWAVGLTHRDRTAISIPVQHNLYSRENSDDLSWR